MGKKSRLSLLKLQGKTVTRENLHDQGLDMVGYVCNPSNTVGGNGRITQRLTLEKLHFHI
jgi:hypothetical protein